MNNFLGKVLLWIVAVFIIWFAFSPSSDPVLKDVKSQEQREQIRGCSISDVDKSLENLRNKSVTGTVQSVGQPFGTQLKQYIGIMGKAKDLLDKSLIVIDNVVNDKCD